MSNAPYKRYPAYKDSGVEWLGEIPAGWEVKRLKYAAPIPHEQAGGFARRGEPASGFENVESWTGRLLLENQPESVDSVVSSFQAGDVLLESSAPISQRLLAPDFDGVCTSEIIPLRPAAECMQSYVLYSLLNPSYIYWLDSMTYGTKMPRVSPELISAGGFAVPEIPSSAPSPPSWTARPLRLMD